MLNVHTFSVNHLLAISYDFPFVNFLFAEPRTFHRRKTRGTGAAQVLEQNYVAPLATSSAETADFFPREYQARRAGVARFGAARFTRHSWQPQSDR